MARVASITSCNSGARSSIVLAFSIRRAFSSILTWKVVLDSFISTRRSMKVSSICRISACASMDRSFAIACLNITSRMRRSTSSRRRKLRGGLTASSNAPIWPSSQLSSSINLLMFSMMRCSSLSKACLISACSSAANDKRWLKISSSDRTLGMSTAGSRSNCNRSTTCSENPSSPLTTAGRMLSIMWASF